jgi:hypothetical protein
MAEKIAVYLTKQELTELIEVMGLHLNDSLRFLEHHEQVPAQFAYLTLAKTILEKLTSAQAQAGQ